MGNAIKIVLFTALVAFNVLLPDVVSESNKLVDERHLDVSNIATAEELLKKELSDGSESRDLLTALARVEFYLGDMETEKAGKIKYYENGIQYGKKAILLDKRSDSAHFWYMSNWGRTIQLKGDKNKIIALKEIRKEIKIILEINPGHVGALSALASYYACVPGIAGGSIEKAEKTILEALSLQPKYTFLYIDAASIYIKMEKYDKAEEMLATMLAVEDPALIADFELMDKPNAEKMLKEIAEKQKPGVHAAVVNAK